MKNISLKCSCGKVKGVAHNVDSKVGNRIICHCLDCQGFAEHIKNEKTILDSYDGTDIFQMPLSQVEITNGQQHIKCIKHTPKGLYRWYADCCKTPIGNTMGANMNFMGVIHSFMGDKKNRDMNLGPVTANCFLKNTPDAQRKQTPTLKMLPTMLYKMIVWKFQKRPASSSFFNEKGVPIVQPKVMNK